MIKINLLPPELQGKKSGKRTKGGKAPRSMPSPSGLGASGNLLVLLVLVVIIILIGGIGSYLWGKYQKPARERAKIQREVKQLQNQYAAEEPKFRKELEQFKTMRNQKEILDALMPENRILWAEKLQMLAALKPVEVYYTELDLAEKIEQVETQQSREDRARWRDQRRKLQKEGMERDQIEAEIGEEPEVREKPIITQTLTLRAISPLADKDDRIQKYLQLIEQMNQYNYMHDGRQRNFSDGFRKISPESNEIFVETGLQEKSDYDDVPVWEFVIKLRTIPFGMKERVETGE